LSWFVVGIVGFTSIFAPFSFLERGIELGA
jgi:hypothetical protein